MSNKVKLTTTNSFEGSEIKEYLQPITAHVVVGMNFFKDFFTGFTDFFGGKSSSYQNTLSKLNQDVLSELRKKAHSIGANCVLSVTIDNDEISAQGKSMLMVTAMGTAAISEFKKVSYDSISSRSILSNDDLAFLIKKEEYINKSLDQTLKVDDELLEFVTINKVSELVPYIVKSLFLIDIVVLEDRKGKVLQYLKEIELTHATEYLYDLLNGNIKHKERTILESLLIEGHFIDYSSIEKLLNSEDLKTQKSGVKLLSKSKQSYSVDDLNLIKTINKNLIDKFPKRGEKSTKKKAFSSKDKEIWICECTGENNHDVIFCSKCGNDIYGFSNTEKNQFDTHVYLSSIENILSKNLSA